MDFLSNKIWVRIFSGHPVEEMVDDYDQEYLLDSLVFHGVKQLPRVDTRTTISRILSSKMSVTDYSSSDLSKCIPSLLE